jgi:hypothetical protein
MAVKTARTVNTATRVAMGWNGTETAGMAGVVVWW